MDATQTLCFVKPKIFTFWVFSEKNLLTPGLVDMVDIKFLSISMNMSFQISVVPGAMKEITERTKCRLGSEVRP